MRKALLQAFLFLFPISLFSQANISGIVNNYAPVSAIDTCANSVTVGNPGFFAPGDTVLLIQMQGAQVNVSNTASFGTVTNYGGAGLYEYNIVQGVTGNQVVFQFEFSNSYDPAGSLQLITVPQYNGATLVGGVNAQPWNGSTGGVITFMVNGTLDLAGQNINANGAGFRGATYVNIASSCNFLTNANAYFYPLGNWQGAPRGEGISALVPGLEWGRGAQANAGGGGNDHNAGGGGGSNLAAGGQGGENQDPGTFNCKGLFPGLGGRALAGSVGQVYLGGGGGAGHGNNTSNSDGGHGGGIIMIKANSIEGNNGIITARGFDGQPSSNDGAGGGGGGGTVFLETGNFGASNLTVIVDGGDGADAANIANRCYGGGGGGGAGAAYLGTPGVPANVTLNRSGGANGVSAGGTSPCAGSALNAAPGLSGILQNGANLVFSSVIPSSAIAINCPAIISVPNAAGQCNAPVTYPTPTASGGCGIVSVVRTQGPASGSPFPVGITTVTFVASDTFGLSDTCSFLVTVSDTQSPQFAPPANINQCNTNVTVAPFQVNDNCGIDSIWNSFNGTADASDIYPVGTTTVTWFAQDSSGNLVQASFNVTVSSGVLRDTTTVNLCQGDSFNGQPYTSDTLLVDSLVAGNGCDSLHYTQIRVGSVFLNPINPTICLGDSFVVGSNAYTMAGNYSDSLISSSGCDSIVNTNLSVGAGSFNPRSVAICQGDSIFLEGTWQTGPGIYYDTVTLGSGCDSIVETTLSVLPNSQSQRNETICRGDSVFLGGAWRFQTGIYYDTLTNSVGCDSVVESNLTVNGSPNTIINESLCQGQSYFAGGANQTTDGTYFDTLAGSNGCDSIIETSLVFNPAPQFNEILTICTGDSAFLAGAWQNQPGIYIDTFSDIQGCDSIVNTTLNVINQITSARNLTICEGDSVFAGGAQQGSSGIYRDTFTSSGGCDSILTTNLTVQPASVNRNERGICVGDSAFLGRAWRFLPGTYYDTTISPGGCLQILETRLFVSPPVVIIEPVQTTTILAGQSIRLEATGSTAYQWTPGNTLSCDDCPNPIASPDVTTTYFVTTSDPNGCPSTDSVTIIVDTVGSVTIPNVFTPNGDGINDEWYIEVQGVEGVEIQIFDRWGQKVFESQDPNARWDGTFNGTLLDAAVFAYYIKLIYPGFQDDLTGDITLIR